MVNETSDDDTSHGSYLGGFEFRRRDNKRRREEEDEIIICESDTRTETESASEEESTDQTKTEDEPVSLNNMEIDKGENEKTEEDDLCVLKVVIEAVTAFQGSSQYQKDLTFQNMKNLGAGAIKELIDGWKELNLEMLRLNVKKQNFFAKFVNAGV